MINKKILSLFLLLIIAFQVGCSSHTMIRSSDPGAKIFVNGQYIGQGTGEYRDTRIVGATNTVRLEKDGCQPTQASFSRDEEFAVGPCIGGVFLLFPFLWIMKYQPEHNFAFDCRPAGK